MERKILVTNVIPESNPTEPEFSKITLPTGPNSKDFQNERVQTKSENQNRLVTLYERAPDIFYKIVSSLQDPEILNLCRIPELQNLCQTKEFWERLWRSEFGTSIPSSPVTSKFKEFSATEFKNSYFRRRAITKLVKKLLKDKSFRNLDWVKGQNLTEQEVVHLVDILPLLPDDKFKTRIYNDLFSIIVKENDINVFDKLVDENTPPMHRVFEDMVHLNRGRMIDILLRRLIPINVKLTISGIPPSSIYSAVTTELPCDTYIFKYIDITKLTDQEREDILTRAIKDNCEELIETLLPMVSPDRYETALIEAVIKNNYGLIRRLSSPKISLDTALYYAKDLQMVKFLYSLDKYLEVNLGLIGHIKDENPEIFVYLISKIKHLSSDTIYPLLNELLPSNLPENEKRKRFKLLIDKLFELNIRNIGSILIFNLLNVMESNKHDYGDFYLEYILSHIKNPKEINIPRYINISLNHSLINSAYIFLNFAKVNNINLREMAKIIDVYPSPFREDLQSYISNFKIRP